MGRWVCELPSGPKFSKMELVEIEGLFLMDSGAPSPVIVSNDNHLYVSFYSSQSTDDPVLKERNFVYDEGAITLKFHLCRHYSFGGPNDETLNGHPYYKLGLRSYSFYEAKESDLVRQCMKVASVHPRYSDLNWRDY